MLRVLVVTAALSSVEFGAEGGKQEVTVSVGSPFVVRLSGCRTCGFEWEAPDVTPARLLSKKYVAPQAKRGGDGVFEFTLEYAEHRDAGIHFEYRRPSQEVAATADLTVHATASLVLAGGDKDEHGCKASIGQAWCPGTDRCVMHDERCPGGTEQCQQVCRDLKAGKSIGYKTNCECEEALVLAGGDKDEHGCKASIGQAWCPGTDRCVMHDERCPGGTEQCQQVCRDLKAGKSIGYETNCECARPVLV